MRHCRLVETRALTETEVILLAFRVFINFLGENPISRSDRENRGKLNEFIPKGNKSVYINVSIDRTLSIIIIFRNFFFRFVIFLYYFKHVLLVIDFIRI